MRKSSYLPDEMEKSPDFVAGGDDWKDFVERTVMAAVAVVAAGVQQELGKCFGVDAINDEVPREQQHQKLEFR